jgi:hypothetical protein
MLIPGLPVSVDNACAARKVPYYFLSHFHGDHLKGLKDGEALMIHNQLNRSAHDTHGCCYDRMGHWTNFLHKNYICTVVGMFLLVFVFTALGSMMTGVVL